MTRGMPGRPGMTVPTTPTAMMRRARSQRVSTVTKLLSIGVREDTRRIFLGRGSWWPLRGRGRLEACAPGMAGRPGRGSRGARRWGLAPDLFEPGVAGALVDAGAD